ncbi:MAG: hypothetical protein AB2637_10810 [Candidatus Thiodiazotropha sp.]|nr:hypothetical protein [Candidatus Thiodiazotropha taylori]MBT3058759.1 hypothetical protein [Candidatus Thiodiazotropha sp. (ex Lucina pensylvanica)]MBT3061867.1 hypothetical protein [Candidatus Thiodiazotropha sp. (ex Lucina pensylvanica)]PUB72892.1 MAG: hypothetical protein DBP03_15340 [gamma proteobacterium symbiont of Ctena orbiculata]PUB76153.1 MAG: hypothetical protein DBO99_14600 [gamma proteobacterium symbiont of Ctena orbiculata]
MTTYNTLILGASYGSLLGTKLLLAGHSVTLVCTRATADLINQAGTLVRMPAKGREGLVEISSNGLPGKLKAQTPGEVNPDEYDLVVLGMQEPQYASPDVRQLVERIIAAGKPCMAIMNMPPMPYLARIPGITMEDLQSCYRNPEIWVDFEPGLVTLASPDPQAFRPPEEAKNILQVSLPTNFKVARFESDEHTAMLRDMEKDIEAIRYQTGDGSVELPVKLKVFDSVFVPLAKWSMLLAGNYRCIGQDEMIPIKDAVHSDLDASRSIYDWVKQLCIELGAKEEDLVPFDKYANAAKGLAKPSSAARALAAGAQSIERVDCIVKRLAGLKDMHSETVDRIVDLVEYHLQKNRRQA